MQQTNPLIRLKLETYQRLKAMSKTQDRAMSKIVERLVNRDKSK